MKGQNPLLSHTLIVGFSAILILVVVTSMNLIRNDLQDFIGNQEAVQVCSIVRGGTEIIVNEEDYISVTNTTKGRITLKLPKKIADLNYRATFSELTLTIQTSGQVDITKICEMGVNATYSGFTRGGLTELIYTQNSDGDKIIQMIRL